jgi:hypothetical protein
MKDQPFSWGVEVDNAFQSLKVSFMTTPLLIHADLSKLFILEMDTFDFIVGVVLSQLGKKNLLYHFSLEPSWMALKSRVIYLKEFNMKSLCIQTIRTCSIS